MCDRVVSEDSYLKLSFPDSYNNKKKKKKKKKKLLIIPLQHWNLFPIGLLQVKWL